MAFTSNQLEAHPLWEASRSLKSALDRFDASGDSEVLERLSSAADAMSIAEGLRGTPAWRFPSSPGQSGDVLGPVLNAVAAMTGALNNAQDNPDAYLAGLSADLSNALDAFGHALAAIPLRSDEPSRDLTAAAVQFEATLVGVVSRLGDGVSQQEERATELERTLEQQRAAAESALADLQGQIATSKVEVTSQVSRLDTAITTQSATFAQSVAAWQQSGAEAIAAFETDAETAIAGATAAAEKARAEQTAQADSVLKGLLDLEAQSRNMVQVTARNTISTGYAQYARRQGIAATVWSIAAVTVALVGMLFVLRSLADISSVSTQEAILKSTASLTILGIAGFMGAEASGHRREARDAKRVQLDLNTLEPFVANLGDGANSIRIKTVERVFSRPPANAGARGASPFSWKSDDQAGDA